MKVVTTKIKKNRETVYDFETPSHSYILGNGIISHNTQEMFSKQVVSGGCLIKGTQIQLSDGTFKEVQDIKEGEFVRTLMGYNKVLATWNPSTLEDGFPECYEVEFEDGYKVTVSENHQFLTDRGWVSAMTLLESDNIVVIR